MGKGENAGYQYVLLFPTVFSKASSLGSIKSGLCGKELTHSQIRHFEVVPNSKKLQATTEMRPLKDFKIQIA